MGHKRIEIDVDNDEKVKVLYALLSNIDYATDEEVQKGEAPRSTDLSSTPKKSGSKEK